MEALTWAAALLLVAGQAMAVGTPAGTAIT
jgi:hypothetical protein